ncbi:SERTA domain-containing protein 3 [Stygiomarasmius scandens]|uniref:SERTA domain-containing protein 3 n=1 Tax=Marasmiellus scandens TaxID=2682957 RepID=A0ABR1JNF4_9AGAR
MGGRPAFKGLRFVWLETQKQPYIDAVKQGDSEGKAKKEEILRAFFRRFPAKNDDEWEPSEAELHAVNDSDPIPEDPVVDTRSMSTEEKAAHDKKEKEISERYARVKGSVGRWLDYRLNKSDGKAVGNGKKKKNHLTPLDLLIRQLAGEPAAKPRKIPESKLWARNNTHVWRAEYDRKLAEWRATNGEITDNSDASGKSFPARTYINLVNHHWSLLSEEERHSWAEKSKQQFEEETKKWENDSFKFSTAPMDRQTCIDNVPHIAQFIVDRICEATGWEASLILGGPEPGDAGRLNVISVHGNSQRANKLSWESAMRQKYKDTVLPLFGDFLKMCFTKAECRSRALDQSNSVASTGESFAEEDGSIVPSSLLTSSVGSNPTPQSKQSTDGPSDSDSVGPGSVNSTEPTVSIWSSSAVPPSESQPCTPPPPSPPASATLGSSPSVGPRSTHSTEPTVSISSSSAAPPSESRSCTPPPPSPPASATLGLSFVSPSPHGSCPPSPIPSPIVSPHSTRGSIKRSGNSIVEQEEGPRKKKVKPQQSKTLPRELERTDAPKDVAEDLQSVPRRRQRGPPRPKDQHVEYLRLDQLTVPTPADAPKYLSGTVIQFGTVLEPLYHRLLCKYLVFEYDQGYVDKKLPAKARPKVVGDWIARARALNYMPKAIDAVNLRQTFMAWYGSIQPDWRSQDHEERWICSKDDFENDWEELCASGQNGALNVVAGLYFWYHAISRMEDEGFRAKEAKAAMLKDWQYHVEDFTYVLIQMSEPIA